MAATVARLPELDSASVAILGLHRSNDRTILHMLASGVTTGMTGRTPAESSPRRSCGYATAAAAGTPRARTARHHRGNTGDVMWWLEIVSPLDRGTAWIDMVTAGQSAELRATLPLRWE
jgi:hypothetical protein